jgi:hypothetical protein
VKRGVEEGNALDIGQFFFAEPDNFQSGKVVSDPVRAEDPVRERKPTEEPDPRAVLADDTSRC